jgi:hypothetical protein
MADSPDSYRDDQKNNKYNHMKKYLQLEISTSETIAFVAILCWIVASCFVPLPEVSSLGR